MREVFSLISDGEISLPGIQYQVIDICKRMRCDMHIPRLGYVAGIISSDGPEHIQRNSQILMRHTEILRTQHDFPLFCSADVFTEKLFARLPEMKLPQREREQKFYNFWRSILQSGHITDVFMTPRWRQSRGSVDEYDTALAENLTIHILD